MKILVRQVRGRRKHPNWSGIVKETERTLDAVAKPRLLEYPKKIVANWEHKPEFRAMKRITRNSIRVYVYPMGPNKKYWVWTSRGTRPHPIEPKRAPILAFPSIYIPKTQPRGPSYGGPGTSSGPTVFAMHVDHPGTKPRHFEEAWGRWAKTWFRREMENAMRRGARRA
jgi:hypothetical protein